VVLASERLSAERVILGVRPSSSCWSCDLLREEFLSAPIHSPLSGLLIGPSKDVCHATASWSRSRAHAATSTRRRTCTPRQARKRRSVRRASRDVSPCHAEHPHAPSRPHRHLSAEPPAFSLAHAPFEAGRRTRGINAGLAFTAKQRETPI
jgi:hypothetical protein